MSLIGENLQRELDARGWNAYDLAHACENIGEPVPQSTIHRILKGGHRDPRTTTVVRIAHALGISEQRLRGLPGHNNIESKINPTHDIGQFKNIVIIGAAKIDDEDWFEMARLDTDAGFIVFPTQDPQAYTIKCTGDGLRPRLQNGEYLVIEPNSPITPGDEILITSNEGLKLIKKFLYERDDLLYLQSINETGPYKTISKSCVSAIHYVAGIVRRKKCLKNNAPGGGGSTLL